MSTDYQGSEELLARTIAFVEDHKRLYLESGGAEGHIMDFTHAGSRGFLPTLLLGTIGRRSGRHLVSPLIYGCYGGEWVVVASKGGAPEHPAWFLNLEERAEATFQIATQGFRGTWRLAAGAERSTVWDYMERLYPPYADYRQAAKDREIPLILLKPLEEAPVFTPVEN